MAKLEESLSEQLLLRSIDSGSVAEQDAFLAAQQVHADFQAQLQGQFEPYPLPPSALQGGPPTCPILLSPPCNSCPSNTVGYSMPWLANGASVASQSPGVPILARRHPTKRCAFRTYCSA